MVPDEFLAQAYIAQNGEAAWPKDDALRVLQWALNHHIPILGVEVWIPTKPGPTIPTPYIYTYEPKLNQSESNAEYAERRIREIINYVETFDWDSRDTTHHAITPYFNFAFVEPDGT